MPVSWAIFESSFPWPQSILFGQEGFILLRRSGRGDPCQHVLVIPGHPFRWVLLQFLGVPQQLGEVVEGIDSVELAGVDQAHK